MALIGARTIWGIDIGGSAVKGIKLRVIPGKRGRGDKASTPERLEILAADTVPCQGEPSPGEPNPRHTRVLTALAEFRRRNRIRDERVVVALPGGSAFVRPFDVMAVGDKSMAEIVTYEVNQLIPFGLDAVVWDYEIFPSHEAEKKHEGLLFAVKKEILNGYLLGLSAANVEVDDVQTAPLALYNFVRHQYRPGRPLLTVDIGASCTDLVAITGDRYWVRSAPIGGDMITRAVGSAFDLPFDKAEAVKLNVGKSKYARRILNVLLPAIRAYVGELKNALAPFRAIAPHVRFDKICLLGNASRTVGLQKLVSQTLGGDAVVPPAFRHLSLGPNVDADAVQDNLPALAVAAGLALQGAGKSDTKVTLVVEGATRRRLVSRTRPFVLAVGMGLSLLLGSVLGFSYYRLHRLTKANAAAQSTIDELSARQKQYRKLMAPTPNTMKMRELQELGAPRAIWAIVLRDLMQYLPDNSSLSLLPNLKLWLTDLEIAKALDRETDLPCATRFRGLAGVAVLRRPSEWETGRFVDRTLAQRLRGHGHFRNVSVEPKGRISAPRRLAASPTGKYYLFDLSFEVDLTPAKKGAKTAPKSGKPPKAAPSGKPARPSAR